jgi:prepilin-type N-terminal cleavage/methylation domain-containing protein
MTRPHAGFTLIELLIGMALLGLFGLIVHQFCTALLRGVRVLEVASEAQEAARLGVQLIAGDAREAGACAAGALPDGVRRAGRHVLAIARDLDGDGDVADANEQVSYQYARDRRALLRAQGDAPPQPLLADLDDDGLSFSYLDADGAPLSSADGELDAAQRARIRRVAVRLAIAIRHPDPAYTEPLRAEAHATATLRNVAP